MCIYICTKLVDRPPEKLKAFTSSPCMELLIACMINPYTGADNVIWLVT